MRKIAVYLILALFLVSAIPAQPSTTAKGKGVTAKPKPAAFSIAATESVEDCIERISEAYPEISEEDLQKKCESGKPKIPVAAKAKIAKARENYQEAKQRYQTARQNYLTAQNNFRGAKQNLKACKDEGSEECAQLQAQIKDRAKEFLLKTADNILEHLNTVKAKVNASEDLSEEEKEEILERIDEMIEEIEEAKSTIESSEDKKEIIDAARTIKKAWSRIKKKLAVHTGRIVNARIGGIVVKTKQLEEKLEKILSRMESKGIDTSGIQDLVDQFGEKANEAEEKYLEALEQFREGALAEDSKTAHEFAVEGHKYMKESHKALQAAQKLLRDILLRIKQAGGEDEIEEDECTADTDCEEDHTCIEGECIEAEEEDECTVDADCDEDEVCTDGECEDAEEEDECTEDVDCDEDEVCTNGECEDAEEGDECTEDADCEEGNVCTEGSCVEAST